MMNLPKELLDKLETAESDVQACKMLADNGINPEEFEKTIPDNFFRSSKRRIRQLRHQHPLS